MIDNPPMELSVKQLHHGRWSSRYKKYSLEATGQLGKLISLAKGRMVLWLIVDGQAGAQDLKKSSGK